MDHPKSLKKFILESDDLEVNKEKDIALESEQGLR